MTVTTRSPGNLNFTPPYTGSDVGTVVGGDDALVTSDGDTSYVQVTDTGSGGFGTGTAITFQWSSAGAIPPDSVVTIEADWWTAEKAGFLVYFVHPTMGSRNMGSFITPSGVDAHAYGDPTALTIPPTWVTDGAAFLPGVEWGVVALRPTLFVPTVVRITRLTLRIETTGGTVVIPLRQFHRDDGLGITPPRAYGGSSRTRTGRAYGYT